MVPRRDGIWTRIDSIRSITIDEYIRSFPEEVRVKLDSLRKLVREAAPDATEKISYQTPPFDLNGNLVHFAAYPKHIGFYPAPSAISHFGSELSAYKRAKGSVQFPIEEPLPTDLITRIVRFRAEENRMRPPKKRSASRT